MRHHHQNYREQTAYPSEIGSRHLHGKGYVHFLPRTYAHSYENHRYPTRGARTQQDQNLGATNHDSLGHRPQGVVSCGQDRP